jgi:hypothetical protein
MPSKTARRKSKSAKVMARPLPKPDPLRLKLHDLANTLEAASLARQFITKRPEIAPALEKLAAGLGDARKALFAMDAGLRGATPAKRRAAAR